MASAWADDAADKFNDALYGRLMTPLHGFFSAYGEYGRKVPAAERAMHGVSGQRIARILAARPATAAERNDARSIIVPETAYLSERPYPLVEAVGRFVTFASRTAHLAPAEMSPNALRSTRVEGYLGALAAGGHARHAIALGEGQDLSDCQEALDAMEHPLGDLHRRLAAFMRANPERMEAVRRSGGMRGVDTFIDELDREYLVIDAERPVTEALRLWLKSLSELVVVRDVELSAVLNAFAAAQHKSGRASKPHRATLEAGLRDPLRQAFTYLCEQAVEPRQFIAWHRGKAGHDLGDGVKVVRFVIETDKGLCTAFFHPTMSLLVDENRRSEPLARLRTERVIAHVARRTGESLMDLLGQ
jgi:hypothetical protein